MNLLPEDFKKSLTLEAWRRFLLFFGLYISLIGLAAVALLLPSFFFLQFQIGAYEAQKIAIEGQEDFRDLQEGEVLVDGINRSVQMFNAFNNSQPAVSDLIYDIFGRIPSDVALSSYSLERDVEGGIKVEMAGVASVRDSVTRLIENLEASPHAGGNKAVVPDHVFKIPVDTAFTLSMNFTL